MTKSLQKIFKKNIEILSTSDKTIAYLRIQNYYMGLNFLSKTINSISSSIEEIIINENYFNELAKVVDLNYINQLLTSIFEAESNHDYILIADLLELQLNPFVNTLQEIIISKEEFAFDQELYDDNLKAIKEKDYNLYQLLMQAASPEDLIETGYHLEYTSCGLMTMALEDGSKRYYLHSNGQALHEAGILAREWFSEEKTNYIIYGLGLGYHIFELMDISDNIKINIYESDLNVIQMACACSNLERIFYSDNVNLLYDPNFKHLSFNLKQIDSNTKFLIHYPSLRNVKDIRIREMLDDYFMLYSSINNQSYKLNTNFEKNISRNDNYIDQIRDKFIGKDLYIIAAGPSLDKNFNQLKNLKENSIILATGTVAKKLINAGIKPDFIIIIDANEGTLKQIDGLELIDIPLLYLSTVYYKVPEQYSGEKYLICQNGFKKAEVYANERGYTLYQTGGSVSTTALDIGIRFGCKRIIFLGLDLAYTNQLDHASGTQSVISVDTSDCRKVIDIYGNKVSTGKNLDIYRKWIEQRIDKEVGIEFIDATEGGAKIKGMKIRKLSEC